MNFKNALWSDKKRSIFGLPLTFTRYSLFEDKLIIDTGCFTKTQDEVRLYRILDITLKKTLGQRIFGLGSIYIESSDKSMGDFVIKNIKNSEIVKDQISDLVEQVRQINNIAPKEFMD